MCVSWNSTMKPRKHDHKITIHKNLGQTFTVWLSLYIQLHMKHEWQFIPVYYQYQTESINFSFMSLSNDKHCNLYQAYQWYNIDKCLHIWLNLPRKYKKIHVISFFALLMIITWTNWLFVPTTERNSNSNLIAMLQLWRWNYLVQLQCPIVSLHETRCVT